MRPAYAQREPGLSLPEELRPELEQQVLRQAEVRRQRQPEPEQLLEPEPEQLLEPEQLPEPVLELQQLGSRPPKLRGDGQQESRSVPMLTK